MAVILPGDLEGRRLRRPGYRGEHSPLLDIGEARGGASAASIKFFTRLSHGLRDTLPRRPVFLRIYQLGRDIVAK